MGHVTSWQPPFWRHITMETCANFTSAGICRTWQPAWLTSLLSCYRTPWQLIHTCETKDCQSVKHSLGQICFIWCWAIELILLLTMQCEYLFTLLIISNIHMAESDLEVILGLLKNMLTYWLLCFFCIETSVWQSVFKDSYMQEWSNGLRQDKYWAKHLSLECRHVWQTCLVFLQ